MRKWLVFAAVLPLLTATAANAQMKGLGTADVARVARTRAVDLRLAQERAFDTRAVVVNGLIARQSFAPNALVGVGLARIYGRNKRGNARITDEPAIGRKPAVTFVLKF
jgi:hypothetical protein